MDYIPQIISLISVIVVVLTFAFARVKDHDGQKENNVKMNLKLDVLCQNTNSILRKVEGHDDRIQSIEKDIAVIERDLKTAFRQIDDVKGSVHHD